VCQGQVLDTCIAQYFFKILFKTNYLDLFMRVIAGQAKGTRLIELKGSPVRPTLDQVKETLFNILGYNLSGEHFLDWFGGSGAIGIEALSRGAEKVIWVENNRKSQELIYANLKKCRFWNGENESSYIKWKLLKMDALQAVSMLEKSCLTFDVIYIDPPFENNLYNECLNVLSGSQLLKASTLVVVEHDKKNSLEKIYGKLSLEDQRIVGSTTLSFYHLKSV
jgi:16S rRNA (guanine966-N2)-methyltransferase